MFPLLHSFSIHHDKSCKKKKKKKKKDELQVCFKNLIFQAIFNLAFLVEEGVIVPREVWKQIRLSVSAQKSNITILTELYTRLV